ncbi:MAG: hypothetical protein SPK63_02070 [Eubacteriales bacterium]|nr:hypothetical protein [Eubacteriales bacterium]
MSYSETKVYFDGSHYIAIPHTTRPTKKRTKPIEEDIIVEENEGSPSLDEPSALITQASNVDLENIKDKSLSQPEFESTQKKKVKSMTKKQLFEELYIKYIDLKKKDRKNKIIEEMKGFFEDYEKAKSFVEKNFDRKQRNLICRRVRMCRKANLANFNYFCTFTYDDKLHTEETFKKKLRTSFRHLCERRNWKYMGVWERAPNTNRLHFHGLFNIPKGMIGELIQVEDYDTKAQRMQTSFQSTYFNERFGRSDFKEIDENENRLGNALAYLMKYIEKTGEKIVYSKGLPQYFISDIMDDDIVCTIGQEDKKLLLFDDFNCWDEGCLMGKVSPEVIEQMRKSN